MTKNQTFRDSWYYKAKREGVKSRAYYKLQQIDQKFKLFKPHQIVVDLCGAPGGFSEYISHALKETGIILLVDQKKVTLNTKNIITITADITSPTTLEQIITHIKKFKGSSTLKKKTVDVVVSDCSPKLTGNRDKDYFEQIWLAKHALSLATKLHAHTFVSKIFQCKEAEGFIKLCKQVYHYVKTFKPQSSRAKSPEMYLICKSLKIPIKPIEVDEEE